MKALSLPELDRMEEDFAAELALAAHGMDTRSRGGIAEMAATMISVAPGVAFCRPESLPAVKGIILATLEWADKMRREGLQ